MNGHASVNLPPLIIRPDHRSDHSAMFFSLTKGHCLSFIPLLDAVLCLCLCCWRSELKHQQQNNTNMPLSDSNYCSFFPAFFFVFAACLASSSHAFNITKLLSQYPDFSNFNEGLTRTGVASQVNSRQTITVLAVSNGAMSGIMGSGDEVIKKVLSVHVVLDYYDASKLQQLPNRSTILTTLYQTTGLAQGQAGFLNVTRTYTNAVVFGSAVPGSTLNSNLVSSIAAVPYNISVLQVSSPIVPPQVGSGGGGGGASNSSTNSTTGAPPPASTGGQPPASSPVGSPPPKIPAPAKAPSSSNSSGPASPPSKASSPSGAVAKPPSTAMSPAPTISTSPAGAPVADEPAADGPTADAPKADSAGAHIRPYLYVISGAWSFTLLLITIIG